MKALPRSSVEFADTDFLAEFDLDSPELSIVRQGVETGDLRGAKVAVVQYFRSRSRPRWIFDLRDGRRGEVCHLWPPVLRSRLADHEASARSALRNGLVLGAGMELKFGRDLNWVTPDTRSPLVPGNAFKCCHFLRALAVAHAATREPAYAEKMAELIGRWVSDWPFELDEDFTGEHMVFCRHYGEKSMPTGQRLFNWISALYSGILFAPEVPAETTFALLKTMWFSAAAYQRFERSAYTSDNHHIMRTVNVPAVMGMFFPETPRLRGLVDLARINMVRHVEGSFLSDGGYSERSSSYAMVTLGMFLAPLAVAKLNRVALLDGSQQQVVQRAAEQMALSVLPSGHLPPVGDGEPPGPPVVASLLGLTTLACDSEVCATVLRRTGLNAHLPSSLRPEPAAARASLPTAVRYPATGIAVLRSSWQRTASAMTMNIPDGENQATNHAHDDALSIGFVARGQPFLWLPGNELYVHVNAPAHRGKETRGYPYSDLSKNVVLVGGKPRQSPVELANSWGTATPAIDSSLQVARRRATLRGGCTLVDGTLVTREIRAHLPATWTIEDHVQGAPRRRHVALFHFDYGVAVEKTSSGVMATRDGVCVDFKFVSERLGSVSLRRNVKWLRANSPRRGQVAPWLLTVRFGGGGDDRLVTELGVASGS